MIFRRSTVSTLVLGLALLVAPRGVLAQDTHDDTHDHAHDHAHKGVEEMPEPLGFDLTSGWLEPWHHTDYSRRGTPFVHMFNLEPAFLDRDLFIDYVVTSAEDEKEQELEAELEYAFTRRLGVVVEAPLVLINPDDGDTETGLGDVAIAPRALLIETDRFLLSGNLELSLPTGSESKGIGSGEVGLAPSVSTWLDLGAWVTFSTQIGAETGLETGDSELFYAAALTYSFQPRAMLDAPTSGHEAHAHLHDGLTSLILEYTGRTILSGEDRHRSTAEVLLGVSHVLSDHIELRAAYTLPVGGERDIDYGFLVGMILHF